MISNFSSCIVRLLIRNNVISGDEFDVYQYGFEIFTSSIITFLITIICGLLFQCMPAALIYFSIFVILRSVCGGYHAKTYFRCNVIFALTTSSILFVYKLVPIEQFTELHYCCMIIALIVTYFYAPVENKNKPLSLKQKNIYRILGRAMVVLLALISCLLEIKYRSPYSILIDSTLFVVAISMFITEPRRGGKKNEQNDEGICFEGNCNYRKKVSRNRL